MTEWDYQVMRLIGKRPGLVEQIEQQLNVQGGVGWELVTIMQLHAGESTAYLAIFKRPVEK